jgi:hypothetical protein
MFSWLDSGNPGVGLHYRGKPRRAVDGAREFVSRLRADCSLLRGAGVRFAGDPP